MPLDTVRAIDHKDSIIKHLQGTLHFRGKINMSRSIQQDDLAIIKWKHRLFGKDRYASLLLHRICIQIGIAMIYTSQTPKLPGAI